ncbi:MAG: CocE/NonD family hydrolase [Dehalococcoidia bacterium]
MTILGTAGNVPAERPSPGEPPRRPISSPLTSQLRIVHDLRVPMRDGVELALDLVRPDLGGPFPAILMRTPYDKTVERGRREAQIRRFAERGYIVALNDCRGRSNSDGEFFPYVNEHDDGFDTVEWIAAQSWCDGNVGMLGLSYAGQTQWQAASRVPPHLKAIVPLASPPSSLWRNEPILNGVLLLGMGEWMVHMGRRSLQTPNFREQLWNEQREYFDALPIGALGTMAGVKCSWWDEWMRHPTYDAMWKRGSYDRYADITVPALNVTGWWDMNFPGAPLNFEAMRREGATADARNGQKLIIGPWAHWMNTSRALSGIDFGEHALIGLDDYVIRFFDRWLKDDDNGIEHEPSVYVFVLGANEWWAEDTWPLRGTEDVPFYFRSAGDANSFNGDGRLSNSPPSGHEPSDSYVYDPLNTAHVLWNMRDGPVDDRIATTRRDVLCYTSEPLAEALDVIGWVTCRLYAASSAPDTDWHVRLVDVYPDGSARFLCRGAMRARFRNSLEDPQPLEPGEPTLFEFSLDGTGVRFLPGHRIRVEVTSSWFTQYDRNLNSGADNPFLDDTPVVAAQTVFHERGLESHVLLPVVHRTGTSPASQIETYAHPTAH